MKIAVVGLGKIGLPLAVQYAVKGHEVAGVDVDQRVVDLVNDGNAPFPGEADLAELLAFTVSEGRLRASTDYTEAVPSADAVVVVVPLIVDETTAEPSFEMLDAATSSIAKNLTPGTLVVYETTLPVGTTRTRWRPRLEAESSLREGHDFHVVFSPERVLTGRVFADLRKYPKLIGALSARGAQLAGAFYDGVLDFDERSDLDRPNGVWDLGSAEAAELAKLAETTYRDVNIGLANQFAVFAHANGIDIHKVIEASNSQPYSHIHRPGVAVGGHCIPVYPRLYLWTDPGATVVQAARAANAAMPEYAIDGLAAIYGPLGGARVVVLGAAYRGGVKETAFSGVFELCAGLARRNATAFVHDPMYSAEELARLGLRPHSMGNAVDAVILHTDHAQYRMLSKEDFPEVRALVDGRSILDLSRWPGVLARTI